MFRTKYLSLVILATVISLPLAANAGCYWFPAAATITGAGAANNCSTKSADTNNTQYCGTPVAGATCACCSDTVGCCVMGLGSTGQKLVNTNFADCHKQANEYYAQNKLGLSLITQFNKDGQVGSDGKSCVTKTAGNNNNNVGNNNNNVGNNNNNVGNNNNNVGNNNNNVGNNITPLIKLTDDKFKNPASFEDVPGLVNKVINAILGIIGAIALLMYILAGIIWLSSAGNDTSVKTAKNILVWTTIGLVVTFGSFVITRFILNAVSQ